MEYLSDWTIILLSVTMGLLAFYSLGAGGGDNLTNGGTESQERLAEFTVALHGVCWSSNIVSTVGAWYSFIFFPVCESLEGKLIGATSNPGDRALLWPGRCLKKIQNKK